MGKRTKPEPLTTLTKRLASWRDELARGGQFASSAPNIIRALELEIEERIHPTKGAEDVG